MKILAIRGKNLASLGDFVLDFQQEPLASAGLFAITGVTGAGKSTILDALCLALYNQTPRLARVKQGSIDLVDVGEHRLRINHSPTLLRRGAIEGFAEVDFLGHDNVVYRAKWSVRRARGQSSGQLQDEQLSLLHVDNGSTIGHRKKEVLEAIQDKIGLSFDEFNRAVLLAQNEFFAFLKSDDNERATLLEALTGTSQFSDLSMQAYLRARHEKDQLNSLLAQLAGQNPLSSEERSQLAVLAQQLEQQVIHEQQQIKQLSTTVTWQHTHSDLQQKLVTAQQGVQQTQLAWQNNLAKQQFFVQIEAIQSARPLMANQERIHSELNKQHTLLLKTSERQQQQQRELQDLQSRQLQTLATLNQHEVAYQIAQPLLEQAKTLDTKLDSQQQRLQQSKDTLTNASQRLNQSSFKLLPQWESLQGLLTQAKHSLSLDDNQAAKEQTLACQADAEKLLTEAQITFSQYDSEAIAQEKNQTTQQLQQQQQSLLHWQDWQNTQQHQHNSQQESETIQQRNLSIDQRLSELTPLLAISTATVQQAQKAQDQAKLACAKNVELLRSQLQNDNPCPVCGSQQHPYNQHINSQLQQLLNTLAAELQQQQRSHEELRTEHIQLNSELQNHKPRLQALISEQQQRQQALLTLENTLNSDSSLMAIEAVEREKWLNNNIKQFNQQLVKLNEQEQHCRLALKQRDTAQALVNASRLLVDCASSLFDYAHESRLQAELRQQRNQYFKGEMVSIIESKLKTDVQHALLIHQQLIEQLNTLKQQNIATIQQQESIEQHNRTLGDELLTANQAMSAWLDSYHLQHPTSSLDGTSLKKLLVHDQIWLQQERLLIQQLQTAITNAETNLQARQQDLQQHLQTQPLSLLAIEQLEQQLADLQNQLQLNQKQLGSYEQQLHQDALRQQQTAALMTQLQTQQAQADIWQQLNSVIGSADGKVFRNAAQQMTLDVLLFYTNAHLKDLAKRYRLERVDNSLGMQVIDQDMGDEVRSVHSLSGGESFLVSLALALGLASLSSQRVKVESLFIDEGFGSLDAETLRVAMDALDILQSQGRKVGVISHVAEMTERIPTQIQVRKGTGGKSSVHVIPEIEG